MEKDLKEKLENSLQSDINEYENISLTSQEKAKAIAIISREAAVIAADEKAEKDEIARQENLELQKEKFEFEKSQKQQENELKEEEIKLRMKEFDLHEREFYHQVSMDCDRNRLEMWKLVGTISVTALGAVLPFVLGIVKVKTYAGLTKNAQDHDYNDYQLESSSSKENRNNIIKN